VIETILGVALTVLAAADTACAETAYDYDEGEAVIAVAVNRSRAWGRPLLSVLMEPAQFAHGCPPGARIQPGHVVIGLRALTGQLRPPPWLTGDVLYFCAPHVVRRWRAKQWLGAVAGRRRHVYWRGRG